MVLNLNSIKDTTLWKHLNDNFKGTSSESLEQTITSNLIEICAAASQGMKSMPSLHPQFTLHDETHLLRVTELMALILGNTLVLRQAWTAALVIENIHYLAY